MATQDIVKDANPKAKSYVDRGANYSAKQAKLEKEEAELEELMKAQYSTDEDQEDDQEDETQEVEYEPEAEVKPEAEDEESDEGLSREEKSFKKRYGDLRRHMADKEKEWKSKLAESTTTSTAIRAPKSDEDIEAWAAKYPDVAAIVETIAAKKANEKFATAEGRLKEFDEANYEASRTKSETTITKAHSDFAELRESDAFHDWVDTQPKVVQDALYENSDDPASVIRVIDLYKVDNGLTPSAKKTQAKDAAKTVSKRTRTPVDDDGAGSKIRESDVAKMSDKQFEDRYDAIQEAMQSGKFVYDVSGKAR